MRTSAATKSSPSLVTLNCVDICLEQAGCQHNRAWSSVSSLCTLWQSFLTAIHPTLSVVCLIFLVVETLSQQGATVNYNQLYDLTLTEKTRAPYLPVERDLTRYGVEPNPGPPKKGAKMMVAVVRPPKPKSKLRRSKTVVAIRGIKGHGGYGEDIGSKIGGWVGDKAMSFIKGITGFGDYAVKSNTLVNGGSPPQFAAGTHCTKICHREFVGIVSSPGSAFTITPYPINPKSPFFPWLSEIALSFEQYKVRGMVVEFKSTSATAVSSTNTALGSVILATQYNVLAPAFSTQQQMEAYQFVTSCSPSSSMIHPIECDPMQNSVSELYIDSSQGDPRLEYLGTTYVATVGQQAASIIGELWISYEIDLLRPKLFSGAASLGLSTLWRAPFPVGSQPTFTNLHVDWFAPFRPGYAAHPLSAPSLPLLGSDLPLSFPLTPGQVQVPGWVSGTYVFSLILNPQGPSFGPWSSSGPTVNIVSGAASLTMIPIVSGFQATPMAFNGGVSGSGAVSFQWSVKFVGNNPGVPVVFFIDPGWDPSFADVNPVNTESLLVSSSSLPS